MKRSASALRILCAISCLLMFSAESISAPPIPNPVLFFLGSEQYENNGTQMIRYRFDVHNREQYPNELFAPAPNLPPCGSNTKSSRTWVVIYDQAGHRLSGFCALKNSDGLNGIWFGLKSDEVPPSWVYIEMNDRQTGTKYKSNLVETSM